MTAHYNDSLRLAVIEGKWAEKRELLPRNISVKPLFDFLSDIVKGNQHAYHYEMVSDSNSFDSSIKRICEDTEIRIVYVGAHGTRNSVDLRNESLDYRKFGDIILENINGTNKKIDGLYLGACLIGNRRVATYILERTTNIKWIAGYSEKIEFTMSTVFDLMFFRYYYYFYDNTSPSSKDALCFVEPFLVNLEGLVNTKLENEKNTKRLGLDHSKVFPKELGLGFSLFTTENGRVIDALRQF